MEHRHGPRGAASLSGTAARGSAVPAGGYPSTRRTKNLGKLIGMAVMRAGLLVLFVVLNISAGWSG